MKTRRSNTNIGRKKGGKFKRFVLLLILCAGAYWAFTQYVPNWRHIDPDWKGKYDKPIFVQDELMKGTAIGEKDNLKLPLPVLQEAIDNNIKYEQKSGSVIITTQRKLVLLKPEDKLATVNNKPMQLRFAPEVVKDIVYLPADLITELYGTEIKQDASGAVLLYQPGEVLQTGKIEGDGKDTVPMRKGASIHEPILYDIPSGTQLRVLENGAVWVYVQLDNGYAGYVKSNKISLGDENTIPVPEQQLSAGKEKWKSRKVNLTWEAVYQAPPKTSSIGALPGVNVVSPTWFSLVDGDGNVKSKADRNYVTWAHGRNMQVWGLFNNSFDPDLTTEALSTFDKRITTILQMLHYAKLYDLDGINIDYENVHTKDKENLNQFMRELWPLAQEQGLVVSIDVTPKSNSEMWSAFLDRRELSKVVDYVIVMAYDEHWAASPKAGSVASLPWTEAAINKIIKEDEIPADKLIMGVPLYTRVWTETQKEGETKVSSKAIGMSKAQEIVKTNKLKPKFLEDVGQNYVEYQEDGATKKIWLEDKKSLEARVKLIKSLNLAGVATWTRSFGSSEAWEVLKTISE
ncbi:spore germination protein YaaH [Paenibacillus turicensis]|uniref:Spore germination protein YaaH n=1 Tax=Paenibacillus turicensis TaxID=160487 RepID=A0ABS4FUW5_9BACL|nr:glycosyl hydrolase family 18 protein [Paenibacillus turicensis]MBP1906365.1 spore germination protein YaaH [Paenibacillus turicensis]